MHGLIASAVQSFFCTTYGSERWGRVTRRAALGFTDFEPMMEYEEHVVLEVLDFVCHDLDRSRDEVLEDLGTHLVSHPTMERFRRLLRFGGADYVDFLHSLEDLPARTRLAVPDLILPDLELTELSAGMYKLFCHNGPPGFGAVMLGVLRAMADDYGALVMLDYRKLMDGREEISVALVQNAFSEGRSFELGARSA